jgi:hypothetical protein
MNVLSRAVEPLRVLHKGWRDEISPNYEKRKTENRENMTSKQTMEKADQVMAATYGRFPLVLTKGEGCTVTDAEGRTYSGWDCRMQSGTRP